MQAEGYLRIDSLRHIPVVSFQQLDHMSVIIPKGP